MSFILVDNDFYNEFSIGKLFMENEEIDGETTTKYFAELLGGQVIEITEAQFLQLVEE